jgi:flagellar protein FlaG
MSSISPSLGIPLTGASQPLSGAASVRLSAAGAGQAASSQTIQSGGSGNGSGGAVTQPNASTGADDLKKLVGNMQSKLSGASSNLEFSVDKDSGRSIVKVTERTTNEVIWQFPSEQALQVSKELDRYLGAFVNRTA